MNTISYSQYEWTDGMTVVPNKINDILIPFIVSLNTSDYNYNYNNSTNNWSTFTGDKINRQSNRHSYRFFGHN